MRLPNGKTKKTKRIQVVPRRTIVSPLNVWTMQKDKVSQCRLTGSTKTLEAIQESQLGVV
jgi:hypothetical protein